MEEKSIESLAEELGRAAREHGARIATAESCPACGGVELMHRGFGRHFLCHYIRSRFEQLV